MENIKQKKATKSEEEENKNKMAVVTRSIDHGRPRFVFVFRFLPSHWLNAKRPPRGTHTHTLNSVKTKNSVKKRHNTSPKKKKHLARGRKNGDGSTFLFRTFSNRFTWNDRWWCDVSIFIRFTECSFGFYLVPTTFSWLNWVLPGLPGLPSFTEFY